MLSHFHLSPARAKWQSCESAWLLVVEIPLGVSTTFEQAHFGRRVGEI
jgi:hypothetical protein